MFSYFFLRQKNNPILPPQNAENGLRTFGFKARRRRYIRSHKPRVLTKFWRRREENSKHDFFLKSETAGLKNNILTSVNHNQSFDYWRRVLWGFPNHQVSLSFFLLGSMCFKQLSTRQPPTQFITDVIEEIGLDRYTTPRSIPTTVKQTKN